MKKQFEISDFVPAMSLQEIVFNLVEREKKRRKAMKISQKELAKRSGVSYASIRRFESTGEISFFSLIEIANALDCLDEFNELFKPNPITNLKDLKL